jgi:hypothetical protein
VDIQKTLTFLDEMCQTAVTEGRQGNPAQLNRLARNPMIAHYLNNVALRTSIPAQQWAEQFPQYIAEADALRESYEHATGQDARMTALEGRLGSLEGKIDTVITRLTEAVPGPKPAKKKAKKPLTEAEQESEAETALDDADPASDEPETEEAEEPTSNEPDEDPSA